MRPRFWSASMRQVSFPKRSIFRYQARLALLYRNRLHISAPWPEHRPMNRHPYRAGQSLLVTVFAGHAYRHSQPTHSFVSVDAARSSLRLIAQGQGCHRSRNPVHFVGVHVPRLLQLLSAVHIPPRNGDRNILIVRDLFCALRVTTLHATLITGERRLSRPAAGFVPLQIKAQPNTRKPMASRLATQRSLVE